MLLMHILNCKVARLNFESALPLLLQVRNLKVSGLDEITAKWIPTRAGNPLLICLFT